MSSVPIQPNLIPVDSPDIRPHSTGPTTEQINAFVNNRIDAPDASGQPNNYQIVDQLNISPAAKQALEDSMARQDLIFAQETHGHQVNKEQVHFVYNGSVHQALENYAQGQGSMDNVVKALQARGERMQDVLNPAAQLDSSSTTNSTDVSA